jgi:chemosensory pili system protein ChpA (sensor histidine kinase/response regulator)
MTPAAITATHPEDLSALAWVHDEVRRSLEAAHKSLRRYLRESESSFMSDVDAVDPAVLRQARAQLHQAVGALELVGLPPATALLRASEAAVQRMIAKPALADLASVELIEKASFALVDFLARKLAGRPVPAVALFPQYRAVQALAGNDRAHPADLWLDDTAAAPAPVADAAASACALDDALRMQAEAQTLALLRRPAGAAARLSALYAGLGNGRAGQADAGLWPLAAAFFEGLAQGLLPTDVYAKRAASRLLAQLRACARSGELAADAQRLRRELLFFCAQAGTAADAPATPRLAAVRRAHGLAARAAVDYEAALLGRHDPAWIVQARKRIAAAKDAWSAAAAGEMQHAVGLGEQFTLVHDSLRRLFTGGDLLGQALHGAAQDTLVRAQAPAPALAMEVATALLWIEAAIDEGEFETEQQAQRVQRLGQRIALARAGSDAGPLDDWMEALYRRVSDRQTMGSVVHELRASLAEAEKLIDAYFRDPAQRAALATAPSHLQAMRGVLSVLGADEASHAVLRMRDDVDALLLAGEGGDGREPSHACVERLTANLGALGFLIDMLGVQPTLARSLFQFDAAAGLLRSQVGVAAAAASGLPRPGDASLQAQAQSLAREAVRADIDDDQLARGLEQLAQQAQGAGLPALADAASDASRDLADADGDLERHQVREQIARTITGLIVDLPEAPAAPAAAPAAPTGLEDDAEMRAVFLDEAREVIAGARQALAALAGAGDDLGELTTVRRAFHTLKGSSRMVGLGDFGEAAWACEQLYNARLAEAPQADADLLGLSQAALDYFDGWVGAIAEAASRGHASAAVRQAADALRLERRRLPLLPPEPASAPAVGTPEPAPRTAAPPPAAAAPSEPGPATVWPEALALPTLPAALPELSEVVDTTPTPLDEALDARSAAEAADRPTLPGGLGPVATDAEQYRVIGPLRVSLVLFNIYLNEADEWSRRLVTELAEWSHELHRAPAESTVAAAHSLAGSSATVGHESLSALARALEHALLRQQALGEGTAAGAGLLLDAADEARRMLHRFAAGFLPEAPQALLERLAAHEAETGEQVRLRSQTGEFLTLVGAPLPEADDDAPAQAAPTAFQLDLGEPDELLPAPPAAEPVAAAEPQAPAEPVAAAAPDTAALLDVAAEPAPAAAGADLGPPVAAVVPLVAAVAGEPAAHAAAPAAARVPVQALDGEDDIDAVDAVDAELFPIFEEEGLELLPQLASRLRDWALRSDDAGAAAACMRTLHTFKGGARLAGAMRVGELAHRLETAIERLLARGGVEAHDVELLQVRADHLGAAFDALRAAGAAPAAAAPVTGPAVVDPAAAAIAPTAAPALAATIDWSRFGASAQTLRQAEAQAAAASPGAVRVRVPLLDRMVNQAGEVSIARARLEGDVGALKASLGDLGDNLGRLRGQLRDLELQAETQITSRMEAAKAAAQDFDPLEFDRYTRFQELTRMMAESVNDVATVQRSLQRALQAAEDDLAVQARLTRDLQDDLLRTRMVEFESLSERLYRVVRQAAKETGKQVRLDVVGGSIEIDRGVLDRMTPAFEHLLRNCVVHGIELPAERSARGKDASGQITVTLRQEGNEVAVEFSDDGGGLDLARIRARGLALGLLGADAQPDDAQLAQLICAPGFSTVTEVTGLAGRGVGMDVVRSEVVAMGGRIEIATTAGAGARFLLVLPLTTAVTQIVLLRSGEARVAAPSTLIERVLRLPSATLAAAYADGALDLGDGALPLYWLGALLDEPGRLVLPPRQATLVVVRSAQQRVVLHVDEVVGNQEAVVKPLGPQLSRLPGMAGITLLPSGQPALIYNPVALATVYGEVARQRVRDALAPVPAAVPTVAEAAPPLVLVVDDSLTVRRVTQRLLAREGYRVALAKDGLEALERLAEEVPAVVLSDIEMPRMDGFDLVRTLRADPRWRALPVIVISSRIAQKHRDVAATLGVERYLGKPYPEEELLAAVAQHARQPVAA